MGSTKRKRNQTNLQLFSHYHPQCVISRPILSPSLCLHPPS